MFVSKAEIKENLVRESSSGHKSGGCPTLEFVIPRLQNWVVHHNQDNIYIVGTIKHHRKIKSNSRIRTSSIISFHKVDGRSLVSTRNSIYELGEPAIPLQGGCGESSYASLQRNMSQGKVASSLLEQDPTDVTRVI